MADIKKAPETIDKKIEKCRWLFTEYCEYKQRIMNEIIEFTDCKEWTSSLYTDGFLILLQKTGDCVRLENFLIMCSYLQKKDCSLTLQMFLELSKLESKYYDYEINNFESSEVNLIGKKEIEKIAAECIREMEG